MQEIFELLPIAARTGASVLITGDTGTGKDLVAEAIHKASNRSRYPFIKVNCGALPESLLESELFGHVRGAFTDAKSDKTGLFVEAEGGTIFLDEISEMHPGLQAKLLQVLQDGEFSRLGGEADVKVDTRILDLLHRRGRLAAGLTPPGGVHPGPGDGVDRGEVAARLAVELAAFLGSKDAHRNLRPGFEIADGNRLHSEIL